MPTSQPPLKGFESLIPGTHEAPSGSVISFSHTPPARHRRGSPILLLLHGWPESRFMWRYAVPALAARGYTLFVPDLPGYGSSTVPAGVSASKHDRVTVGSSLLSAVRAAYPDDDEQGSSGPRIVLVGHDRGARVSQRLATSPPPAAATAILGAMLLDIVPYSAQWAAHGANPRAATAYFHWAFLPCADLSTPMIKAFGGGAFCKAIVERGVGDNAAGRARVYADGAVEDHYAALYERDAVIEGAAADYGAGAAEDWDEEMRDRELGRRIGVPTYVVYSERNLGRMHGDVKKIWREWVREDVAFEVHGVGNGIGHYLPEEAPDEINAHIFRFLESLGV
ncbi:Alpha/Beta hydrolase protein [Biscogniauxia mediterranea]|nr:Alpha/Beta hydrolase protein [Biscogniauxia mediterranea]